MSWPPRMHLPWRCPNVNRHRIFIQLKVTWYLKADRKNKNWKSVRTQINWWKRRGQVISRTVSATIGQRVTKCVSWPSSSRWMSNQSSQDVPFVHRHHLVHASTSSRGCTRTLPRMRFERRCWRRETRYLPSCETCLVETEIQDGYEGTVRGWYSPDGTHPWAQQGVSFFLTKRIGDAICPPVFLLYQTVFRFSFFWKKRCVLVHGKNKSVPPLRKVHSAQLILVAYGSRLSKLLDL